MAMPRALAGSGCPAAQPGCPALTTTVTCGLPPHAGKEAAALPVSVDPRAEALETGEGEGMDAAAASAAEQAELEALFTSDDDDETAALEKALDDTKREIKDIKTDLEDLQKQLDAVNDDILRKKAVFERTRQELERRAEARAALAAAGSIHSGAAVTAGAGSGGTSKTTAAGAQHPAPHGANTRACPGRLAPLVAGAVWPSLRCSAFVVASRVRPHARLLIRGLGRGRTHVPCPASGVSCPVSRVPCPHCPCPCPPSVSKSRSRAAPR